MPRLVILIIISLVSSSHLNGQAIISGKILNHDGKTPISYYETKQGILAPYWKEVMPDINGKFKIKIDNPGFATCQVFYQGLVYRFFHNNESRIYFELDHKKITNAYSTDLLKRDSIKRLATVKILGDYQEVNNFYLNSPRISLYKVRSVAGSPYSIPILAMEDPTTISMYIDSLIQSELLQINSIQLISIEGSLKSDKVQDVREFLSNEVYAYFASVFYNGLFLKQKQQIIGERVNPDTTLNIYNEEWERLIQSTFKYLKNRLNPQPTSWDYQQLLHGLEYTMNSYNDYDHHSQATDKTIEKGLITIDSLLFNDPQSILAFKLMNLQMFLNGPIFYSPTLLEAVYEIQRQYPESEHIAYYEPLIQKLKKSVEAESKSFDKGILVKKNYTSFADLIDQFNGENLLIDVWATWCRPCLQEFKHKKDLQQYIDSGDITMLYISVDKPEWKNAWRQSLKYNELEGFHIRANNELINDMWDVLGGRKRAIPRYALIAKDGSVFKATASKPSDGDLLAREIAEMIKYTNK